MGSGSSDCIFCRIAAAAIPVALLHEDEQCVAFADVRPQAPIHLLVVPREHISSLAACESAESALLGHLVLVASRLAKRIPEASGGYRVVVNSGPDAGQSVDHLHVHLLAGRPLSWPPG